MPSQNQFLSFFYNDNRIRVIVDNTNEVLFCLADICRALKWYRNNVISVVNKIKAEFKISTLPEYKFNRKHSVMITKSWLYFLISWVRESSKAKEFTNWLDTEVFPALTNIKVKYYNPEQISKMEVLPQESQVPKSYSEALLEAGRLALENEKLLTQAKENELKIEALREFLSAYRGFILEVDKILDKLDKLES